MDIAAPFLHEFTYQAMCHDLLHLDESGKYQFVCLFVLHSSGLISVALRSHTFRNESGQDEEADMVLNDDDKVWIDVRHMHMKDALDRLIEAFRQFSSEQGGAG